MRLRRVLIPTCVAVLLVMVMLTPLRPYADIVQLAGDFYEFKWGSPPDVQFTGKQKLDKDDKLHVGDYWEAVYNVKVRYCIGPGSDPKKEIKATLTQYLQNILGQLKYKYPYIYIFYADFRYEGDEDDPSSPYWYWAKYRVIVIGKVMSAPTTTEAGQTKMVAPWVAVAVLLALLTATMVAGKMIIDDPNFWKLLSVGGSAISSAASVAGNAVASAGPALWVMVAGVGLLLIAFAIAMIAATLSRPARAVEAATG